MHRHINCIAHNSSEGRLLIGDSFAAIVDCGMAFCADITIRNIKNALNGKTLDYILLTHTHYDHVGALPYFRAEWPGAQLVTSIIGAEILLKDTPRRVIRELSAAAANRFGARSGAGADAEAGADVGMDENKYSFMGAAYDDSAFYADIIAKEGDTIHLGGLSPAALETPGHTRDSLCFYVPELELLMLNETPGVLMPDGSVYPCYLTGYMDTINSIEKCRAMNSKELSLPHRGIVSGDETEDFFNKAMKANAACYEIVTDMLRQGLNDDDILREFYKKYYSDALLTYQPKEAFEANAKAIINCTKREVEAGPAV